jgi:hypothetical protein
LHSTFMAVNMRQRENMGEYGRIWENMGEYGKI